MTPDPRPHKRIKDRDAIRRFRLENRNEPCQICELRSGSQVHHATFRSQGGGDTPDNLVWLRPTFAPTAMITFIPEMPRYDRSQKDWQVSAGNYDHYRLLADERAVVVGSHLPSCQRHQQ